MAIGQDNEVIELLTRAVKSVSKIPVIVKLTPNITSVSSAASAALKGGADGICAINTVLSIAGVDLETLTPYPNIGGKSTYGGLSGYCVKPIGLRCVAEVSNFMELNNYKSTSIHACGGVSDWKDVAEYIALGADVTQVCTEVMLKGMQIIDKLKFGLENYLEKKNFNSLQELKGAAISKITSHGNLDRNYSVKAEIDYQKCNNCGSCIVACSDSAYNAISSINNKTVIDKILCEGCSLCSFVCPSNAITMNSMN
jgi:dihydropyrimidine dehydrogenase (NAD+) subunit PreA